MSPVAKWETIVEIDHLARCFGKHQALDDVTLRVERGSVFGLVGENGAGKTTLIKHILGLLKPTHGSVRVFGLDPVRDPVGVLARIGYLSEDRDLPDWMTVAQLMRYNQAFFPGWDEPFANQLREQFELDPKQQVKRLSRGQRAARAADCLGPSAGTADFGRAVLGLGPRRSQRHSRGHHSYGRRRGPHGALFLAFARRSRTRRRPSGNPASGARGTQCSAGRNPAQAIDAWCCDSRRPERRGPTCLACFRSAAKAANGRCCATAVSKNCEPRRRGPAPGRRGRNADVG